MAPRAEVGDWRDSKSYRLSANSAIFMRTTIDPKLDPDQRTKPWTVVVSIEFEKRLNADVVWDRLLSPLCNFRRFRSVPVMRGNAVYMEEAKSIEKENHLFETDGSSWSDYDLRKYIESRHGQKSRDVSRPLWKGMIIHGFKRKDVLVLEIDHIVGDGIALMATLLEHLDEPMPKLPVPRPRKQVGILERIQGIVEGMAQPTIRMCLAPDEPSSLKNRAISDLSGELVVADAIPFELSKVKTIASKVAGSTVNMVLTASLGLAFNAYLTENGEKTIAHRRRGFRTAYTITMRATRDGKSEGMLGAASMCEGDFGSRTTSGLVHYLPGKLSKRLDMVWSVRKEAIKTSYSIQPWIQYVALKFLDPLLSTSQLKWLYEFMMSKYYCTMTNLPGPITPAYFDSNKVTGVRFYTFLPSSLYVGMFSYDGKVTTQFVADSNVVKKPTRLAELWAIEMEHLYEEAQAIAGPAPEPDQLPEPYETELLKWLWVITGFSLVSAICYCTVLIPN